MQATDVEREAFLRNVVHVIRSVTALLDKSVGSGQLSCGPIDAFSFIASPLDAFILPRGDVVVVGWSIPLARPHAPKSRSTSLLRCVGAGTVPISVAAVALAATAQALASTHSGGLSFVALPLDAVAITLPPHHAPSTIVCSLGGAAAAAIAARTRSPRALLPALISAAPATAPEVIASAASGGRGWGAIVSAAADTWFVGVVLLGCVLLSAKRAKPRAADASLSSQSPSHEPLTTPPPPTRSAPLEAVLHRFALFCETISRVGETVPHATPTVPSASPSRPEWRAIYRCFRGMARSSAPAVRACSTLCGSDSVCESERCCVETLLQIALLCIAWRPNHRPSLSLVVDAVAECVRLGKGREDGRRVVGGTSSAREPLDDHEPCDEPCDDTSGGSGLPSPCTSSLTALFEDVKMRYSCAPTDDVCWSRCRRTPPTPLSWVGVSVPPTCAAELLASTEVAAAEQCAGHRSHGGGGGSCAPAGYDGGVGGCGSTSTPSSLGFVARASGVSPFADASWAATSSRAVVSSSFDTILHSTSPHTLQGSGGDVGGGGDSHRGSHPFARIRTIAVRPQSSQRRPFLADCSQSRVLCDGLRAPPLKARAFVMRAADAAAAAYGACVQGSATPLTAAQLSASSATPTSVVRLLSRAPSFATLSVALCAAEAVGTVTRVGAPAHAADAPTVCDVVSIPTSFFAVKGSRGSGAGVTVPVKGASVGPLGYPPATAHTVPPLQGEPDGHCLAQPASADGAAAVAALRLSHALRSGMARWDVAQTTPPSEEHFNTSSRTLNVPAPYSVLLTAAHATLDNPADEPPLTRSHSQTPSHPSAAQRCARILAQCVADTPQCAARDALLKAAARVATASDGCAPSRRASLSSNPSGGLGVAHADDLSKGSVGATHTLLVAGRSGSHPPGNVLVPCQGDESSVVGNIVLRLTSSQSSEQARRRTCWQRALVDHASHATTHSAVVAGWHLLLSQLRVVTESDRTISVDLPRCASLSPAVAVVHRTSVLLRLLSAAIYECTGGAGGYWQGLDSLAVTLLTAGGSGGVDHASTIIDFKLCFSIARSFVPALTIPPLAVRRVRGGGGMGWNIRVLLQAFKCLLRFHDAPVAERLEGAGVPPDVYALPWLLSMFAHTLPYHTTISLWDKLLPCCAAGGEVALLLCVAVVVQRRQSLALSDFATAVQTLSREGVATAFDVDSVWSLTRSLAAATPPSLLTFPPSVFLDPPSTAHAAANDRGNSASPLEVHPRTLPVDGGGAVGGSAASRVQFNLRPSLSDPAVSNIDGAIPDGVPTPPAIATAATEPASEERALPPPRTVKSTTAQHSSGLRSSTPSLHVSIGGYTGVCEGGALPSVPVVTAADAGSIVRAATDAHNRDASAGYAQRAVEFYVADKALSPLHRVLDVAPIGCAGGDPGVVIVDLSPDSMASGLGSEAVRVVKVPDILRFAKLRRVNGGSLASRSVDGSAGVAASERRAGSGGGVGAEYVHPSTRTPGVGGSAPTFTRRGSGGPVFEEDTFASTTNVATTTSRLDAVAAPVWDGESAVPHTLTQSFTSSGGWVGRECGASLGGGGSQPSNNPGRSSDGSSRRSSTHGGGGAERVTHVGASQVRAPSPPPVTPSSGRYTPPPTAQQPLARSSCPSALRSTMLRAAGVPSALEQIVGPLENSCEYSRRGHSFRAPTARGALGPSRNPSSLTSALNVSDEMYYNTAAVDMDVRDPVDRVVGAVAAVCPSALTPRGPTDRGPFIFVYGGGRSWVGGFGAAVGVAEGLIQRGTLRVAAVLGDDGMV